MCQNKYLFISTIIHATAENNQPQEKHREEQIQRLCICIKEIKRKGKLPGIVSDAGGKVDTKPYSYTSITLKTLCRHTEQSSYSQGKS